MKVAFSVVVLVSFSVCIVRAEAARPNVILCMADDLGWGDTGYNGNRVIRTPHLDRMAVEGVRFDRFYAGAPVCSPTRGSCITGRHPYRYGIYTANSGHMKKPELTLAEVLKTQGYITGHFGKWHLGTLTTKFKDSNRGGPRGKKHYSPPWENGFDVCFSTEAKVPTHDPMKKPKGAGNKAWEPLTKGDAYLQDGTRYWDGPDSHVTENLEGDDSRVIMDRAIPFLRKAVADGKPFFAVIWFHAPHLPVVAGPRHAKMYEKYDVFKRNYYGCITALDEQIGRLRAELEKLGVNDKTLLWFSSDNGPEGKAQSAPGSAGAFRGRKRSLYEGGVRVPGLLVWPGGVEKAMVVKMPCSTSDYFPTVMNILGYELPEAKTRPYDGVSLLPALKGEMGQRPRPIGFVSRSQLSLSDNRYKLYSSDGGKSFELYDLIADPGESRDLAKEKPDIVETMTEKLTSWRQSCDRSDAGGDYGSN